MVEQFPCIIAVFEKAVQDEAQARVEFGPIDPPAEHKIPHHKMDHADQSGRGRLESGKTFESRIAFTA